MNVLAYILSGLALLLSVQFFVKLPMPPLGFLLVIPKLAAGALSPFWAVIGVAGAVIGWLNQAPWAIPMGILGAVVMIWYVWRNTRDHKGLEDAFGAGWSDQTYGQKALGGVFEDERICKAHMGARYTILDDSWYGSAAAM